MNIRKMLKLKKWILDEPRRYHQGVWMSRESFTVVDQRPPCGTVACLAGSACLMEGYDTKNQSAFIAFVSKNGGKLRPIKTVACEILGLTPYQAANLFDGTCDGWEEGNANAYDNAKSPLDRARAAAAEIDRLIALERAKRK